MNPKPDLVWQSHPASALADDASLRQAWDALQHQRGDLPFLSADAMAAAVAVFGDGSQRLFVGRSGDTPMAMFVLQPAGRLRWATFQPSQVPLGAFAAAQGLRLADLGQQLLRRALGPGLVVSITQVDPRWYPREADTAVEKSDDYIETAWLPLEGSFEAYWEARGKNLRQNMRKQRNKLTSEGTTTTLRIWTAEQDMRPALARYGQLESTGWKAGGGTAIHLENDQGRFYERLLREAARRGEALFTEYLFDDRTVAMNFGLQRGGTWVVLKTTYDESIARSLSPASLLREEELQHFFRTGEVGNLEYYGRMMEWHTKLTDKHCTLYHLTCYRWPWVCKLAQWKRAREAAPATAAAAALVDEAATP